MSTPSTSATAPLPELDDERAAQRLQRNALLFQLLPATALGLLAAFALLVAAGARDHGVDAELHRTWWAHHAEYDCCSVSSDKCAPAIDALVELRARIADRQGSLRQRTAVVVAGGLGVTDLDVNHAPASAADVDGWFARCPVLAAQR